MMMMMMISLSSTSKVFKLATIPDQVKTLVCPVSFRNFLGHIINK